jgi:hypothetical protein
MAWVTDAAGAASRAGWRNEKRGEECPVLGPQSRRALITEPSLQDRDLVAQDKGLGVLLAIGHRQQSQRGERVSDGEIGEADQHEL